MFTFFHHKTTMSIPHSPHPAIQSNEEANVHPLIPSIFVYIFLIRKFKYWSRFIMKKKLAASVICLFIIACGDNSSEVSAPEESLSSEEISSSTAPESSCSVESSSETSSSSSDESSSSSIITAWKYLNPEMSYGEITDPRDGKVYKTLKLNGKNWMAENLNFDTGDTLGTWCAGDNCALYGRLYTFATAMDSAKSNCGYKVKCNLPEQFQGICPDGWHVPSGADLETIYYLGDTLSRAGGWADKSFPNITGLTLLLAGEMSVDAYGRHNYYDGLTAFWAHTDYTDSTADIFMSNSKMKYGAGVYDKRAGFSIRCLENYEKKEVIDPATVRKDSFVDKRDGQTYKTVTIGHQTWMAENLNYADTAYNAILKEQSWSIFDDSDSAKVYGRLYTWTVAMDSGNFDYSFLNRRMSQEPIRGICPEGWHLPMSYEFDDLLVSIGGRDGFVHLLKANVGWSEEPGNDEYGLSLVGSGYYDRDEKSFIDGFYCSELHQKVYLWTADPVYNSNEYFKDKQARAYFYDEAQHQYTEYMGADYFKKTNAFAIRCVMD